MRLGMFLGENAPNNWTLDEMADEAVWLETAGFDHAWLPYVPWSYDAFVAMAIVAAATNTIELGTAVVPTYPVHPMAMARSAMTVQAASSNRFTLGIGPSHRGVIEGMYGYSYDRPRAHTADYVAALHRAFELDGHAEAQSGSFDYSAIFSLPRVDELKAPTLLIAALAPRMLQLAGEHTDGTILWFADEHALVTHVLPNIRPAASGAGRAAPRIVSCMPTAVCDDDATAREHGAKVFAAYRSIPTYQRILDAGASERPEDVILVGTQSTITTRLQQWAELGVTDVVCSPFPLPGDRRGSLARTRDALASINASGVLA